MLMGMIKVIVPFGFIIFYGTSDAVPPDGCMPFVLLGFLCVKQNYAILCLFFVLFSYFY